MTDVVTQGWFSRIGDSIKGILFGVVLFLASFVVLWMNEGNAVNEYKAIKEGASKAIVLTDINKIDASNEKKPVHLTGRAETDETVTDADFGIEEKALALSRQVQIYQWVEKSDKETTKKVGGSTETKTSYSYEKQWVSKPVNSSKFNKADAPENKRTTLPYSDYDDAAEKVRVGVFDLAPFVRGKINTSEALTLEAADVKVPEGATLTGNMIYIGANASSPEIDDVRVNFSIVPQQEVSIIAKQEGNNLVAVVANNRTRAWVSPGKKSLEQMVEEANKSVAMWTWIFRAVGFFMMFIGINLVLKPLSVTGDVIPFIGSIIGAGAAIIAGLVAGALSLITIAIAWVAYRPLLGVPLLIVAFGLLFLVWKKKREAEPVVAGGAGLEAVANSEPPPPPPPPPPAG